MARTWGQGRKLPKSSSTQTGVLTESPTSVDGVAWVAPTAPAASAFTPTTTGDWPGTDPVTIQQALDQLAARLNVLEP